MIEEVNVDKLIELVERNIGTWKPLAVAIVDVNYKVWGEKGSVPKNILDYYKKFPLSGMRVGDSINNNGSFLMKVTEKTGVIVILGDHQISRLATINLRGRLNALSDFYNLEKLVKEPLSEEVNVDKLIELVELNVGKWKPLAVAIVDVNYKLWGEKGSVPKNILDYYKKFSLSDMQVGDNVNNNGSFLMKVTKKTGVIVVMGDHQISRLAAINLRERLNALSDFYNLENLIKEEEKNPLSEASNVENLIELVERNIGNWKPSSLAIVDLNYKVWGEKGSVPKNILDYYKKFPLSDMQMGDNMNNSGSFLMKVNEETGIIAVMGDLQISRRAAITLRGRLNNLSEFCAQLSQKREG
ncbi:MAG: hypothetical protein WED07_14060 [Candidatus Freyarchaeum deiterrae]